MMLTITITVATVLFTSTTLWRRKKLSPERIPKSVKRFSDQDARQKNI